MRRFRLTIYAAALPLAGLLASCSGDAGETNPEATELPKELAGELNKAPKAITSEGGTPLKDRVATLGLLNKRNNLTRDITIKPGEAKRFGNVIVKLASCERTAPWESPPETGAFVQVLVQQRATVDDPLRWQRIFSGWLFKNSPSINVVEHPIYDVWVKDCAMKYPGEDAPRPAPAASAPAAASTDANPSGSEEAGEAR